MNEITILLDLANYVLILVLVALGLAIVFGLMRVINMAHGEFLMLGAYCVLAVERAGGSFWLALAVAPLALAALGLIVEELLIRRIYHRIVDTILASWGLSLLLKQGIVLLFGPGSHSIASPLDWEWPVLGSPYPVYRLFVMVMALAAVAVTFWLFFATRFGLAARSTIANRTMASCLGIDTRLLDRFTFAYGAALAGLAGAVMAPLVSLDPQLGLGFLVPAFLAILVGGLGSITGPIVGASVIGASDHLTSLYYSPVWAQLVVFLTAILVLRLFPRGLVEAGKRSA